MNEGPQSMDMNRAKAAVTAAAVVGFNAGWPLFWCQASLLRLWGGNAAKLLLHQSSLLRLWADTAPKPLFELQSAMLRFCADNCELVARSYDERAEVVTTAVEQHQFGTLLQSLPARLSGASENHGGHLGRKEVSPNSDEAQNKNRPVIDQMSNLVAEDMRKLSETSEVLATDQEETALRHAAIPFGETAKSAIEAEQRAPRASEAYAEKRAPSSKKLARKTMKSQKKPRRK